MAWNIQICKKSKIVRKILRWKNLGEKKCWNLKKKNSKNKSCLKLPDLPRNHISKGGGWGQWIDRHRTVTPRVAPCSGKARQKSKLRQGKQCHGRVRCFLQMLHLKPEIDQLCTKFGPKIVSLHATKIDQKSFWDQLEWLSPSSNLKGGLPAVKWWIFILPMHRA